LDAAFIQISVAEIRGAAEITRLANEIDFIPVIIFPDQTAVAQDVLTQMACNIVDCVHIIP
jgi:hypothetical protein